MDILLNFLMYSLPGGFLGSVFTWLVGRREHNNDMLSKLQASINMLSEENRKILAENVQLRKENAGLQANQEEILKTQRDLLTGGVNDNRLRIPRHAGERPVGDCDNDDHGHDGTPDDPCRHGGGDSGGVGESGCADTEPP